MLTWATKGGVAPALSRSTSTVAAPRPELRLVADPSAGEDGDTMPRLAVLAGIAMAFGVACGGSSESDTTGQSGGSGGTGAASGGICVDHQ